MGIKKHLQVFLLLFIALIVLALIWMTFSDSLNPGEKISESECASLVINEDVNKIINKEFLVSTPNWSAVFNNSIPPDKFSFNIRTFNRQDRFAVKVKNKSFEKKVISGGASLAIKTSKGWEPVRVSRGDCNNMLLSPLMVRKDSFLPFQEIEYSIPKDVSICIGDDIGQRTIEQRLPSGCYLVHFFLDYKSEYENEDNRFGEKIIIR